MRNQTQCLVDTSPHAMSLCGPCPDLGVGARRMPGEANEGARDGRAVRPRRVLGLHKVNNVLRGIHRHKQKHQHTAGTNRALALSICFEQQLNSS